jgi:hypothetical protein
LGFCGLGFGFWVLGFGFCGLGFGVWGLGFWALGLYLMIASRILRTPGNAARSFFSHMVLFDLPALITFRVEGRGFGILGLGLRV